MCSPYGLGEHRKDADHAYVRDLEASLFPELCDVLGRWHGVSSDPRYWRIILGHWFRRYVEVIFNRTRTLQACFSEYSNCSTTLLESPVYRLTTRDSNSAVWAFNDDRWNHELYARLMECMPEIDIQYETVIDDSGEVGFKLPCKKTPNLRTRMVFGLRNLVDNILALLRSDYDVVIINSYLPRKEELKLQLKLGQCPRFLSSNAPVMKMEPDAALRNKLSQQIAGNVTSKIDYLARKLLFELLPVCYLETFASVKEQCRRLPWPKKPRAVFTSNNFDTDELFKSWVADKVLQGTKYIIGQHGNNYGTHRHHANPSIEELCADRFLTWGWRDGLPQHCPAIMLKTVGRKTVWSEQADKLLLIESGLPHRLSTWDGVAEFEKYFEDQRRFVGQLAKDPFNQLRIRLCHAAKQMEWGEAERWSEFDPALKVEDGSQDIAALIAESRLVVHSYDSTGILETLSQDIPTIAFWQNELEHVRDSARPWYRLLIDAGVIHLSAASAAAHVNEVWNDVAGWWNRAEIQDARMVFCRQYAHASDQPLKDIKALLRFD